MVRPREHEKLAPVADYVPSKVEGACSIGKRVVVSNRCWVDVVVLVKENLVAGFSEFHKSEHPGELASGANGARVG